MDKAEVASPNFKNPGGINFPYQLFCDPNTVTSKNLMAMQ